MKRRLRIAFHLVRSTTLWEGLDYLFGCRIRWICDKYEYHLTGEVGTFPNDPPHRSKCHCGDPADYKDTRCMIWCWPCKYGYHETCSCSHPPYTLPEGT